MNFTFKPLAMAAVLAIGSLALPAWAINVIDLTTSGSSGSVTVGGKTGTFVQSFDQSTGTGVLNPFLRLQATGTEIGFNTDAGSVPFDDKAGIWTHALLFSDMVLDPTGKYRFFLDINQTSANPLLTLNDLRFYRSDSAVLTTNVGLTELWNMDGGAQGDTSVELNYSLNPGSGGGDMYFTLDASALTGGTGKYLYMYTSFGNANGSNDGFEEWATKTATAPVPEPGTYALMLAGLGVVGFMAKRRRAQG